MLVDPVDVVLRSFHSLAARTGAPALPGSFEAAEQRRLRSLSIDTQRTLVAVVVCATGLPDGLTLAHVVASLRGCSVEEAATLEHACRAVQDATSGEAVPLLVAVCDWPEERAAAALCRLEAHHERLVERSLL